MAKGVYNKKRPTAKKVSNFDTKVIVIASIVFFAVIAIIVAAIVIDSSAKSYIGSVDGTKISVFDYKLFLSSVKAEMEDEAEDFDSTTFWTEEKKKEAQDKALEEVGEFYAEFLIAKKNGFALTKTERSTLQTNLINTIQYYHKYYYTSVSLDDLTAYVTGADIGYDDINDYVKYYAKQQAISDYKTDLMEGFEIDHLKYIDEDTEQVVSTGEQAIKDEYEKNRDSYRRIDLTTLAISKSSVTKPTEPTEVKEPTAPETEDETSAEWVKYKNDLDSYNKYVGDKKKYDEDLKKYEDDLAVLRTKVAAIYSALLENGKYTGKGIKELETEEKDADGNKIKAVTDYTDATLEDIAEKEGALYASAKGANTFYGEPDSTSLLAIFAHSIEWTDSTKTAVHSDLVEKWADSGEEGEEGEEGETETETETESEDTHDHEYENAWKEFANNYALESITEDGKFKETKLILIEDSSNFYIVKCTGILDLENSTEPAPSEEEADENTILSVRAVVIRTLKYATVDDDVKIMVKDAGTKYAVAGQKEKNIARVSKEIFG